MRWYVCAVWLMTGLLSGASAADLPPGGWRIDFATCKLVRNIPAGWEFQAGKLFVPDTTFAVRDDREGQRVLVVTADRSTGMLMGLAGGDLKRCPILRWKWRVRNLPKGGDSRFEDRDDQALAIYLGAGGTLHRKSVSYRWDTDTPIGTEGVLTYAAGLVSTFYRTVCNRETPLHEWRIEEVDVAADFQKQFGYLPEPDQYIIGVAANSQHTGSDTVGEVAWIELVPRPEKKVTSDSSAPVR